MSILVIGDSWAAAREADTGNDMGWPQLMGIDLEYRRGVSGSTAEQWAANYHGWLDQARSLDADVVVISLMGNDARLALRDGNLTLGALLAHQRAMRSVVEAVRRSVTIVICYADPFSGDRPEAAAGVDILNVLIRRACLGLGVEHAETGRWLTREHFLGGDIHPTRAGHAVIAERMAELIRAERLRRMASPGVEGPVGA